MASSSTPRSAGKIATASQGPSFHRLLPGFLSGAGEVEIRGTASIKTLEPHICPTSIGFPSTVSDVYRADQFIRELKQFDAKGNCPT